MNCNFSVLSDFEFQQLVNKLLTGKTRVVEQYAEGRDNGIDGLVRDIPDGAHIQAKHFLKSGFSKLKSKIENEEVLKIKNKGIACYVLGSVSISSLLDNDPATLKSTVKLWAANAEIVRAVLKPANMNCFYELQNRWEDLNKVFVETPDIKRVVDSLEKNHVSVIAGY